MPPRSTLPRAAALIALLLAPVVAHAQFLRLVSSDEGGVTLRLSLPEVRFPAPGPDGRVELGIRGLVVTGVPGRPLLPYAQTLIALPPGASATARVIGGAAEEQRDGVRLAIGAKPVMRETNDEFGPVPGREPVPPILDGPWPTAPVEVSVPVDLRGQRIVAVQVHPFRYDETTGRLWIRRSMTVRVDFAGPVTRRTGLPTSDRHWDPVLRSALANFEQGRGWRTPQRALAAPVRARPAAAQVQGAAGFDEDEPEVRIEVDTTGVYAFPYARLASHGYPSGVPIAEVSLHRHEYVGSVDPPYVTIELPIEVDDVNGNGIFDGDDRIVAYVRSWAERAGITSMMQREWGDAEVVYATRVLGRSGRRTVTRAGWQSAPIAPLASYPARQHWERNYQYFPFPSPLDTATVDRFQWTTSSFRYDFRPDTIVLDLNDVDAGNPISMHVAFQGTDFYTHVLFGEVRNGLGLTTPLMDSTTATWYGEVPDTVKVQLPGTALTSGSTNRVRLWGHGYSPFDGTFLNTCNERLNSVDAVYWRSFRALAGYLDANSGTASGTFQIHAFGFGSNALRVYDVTDSLPVRVLSDSITVPGPGSYAIDFQGTADGITPRRYVIFDTPRTPPPDHYGTVTRRHLTAAIGEQDYLIVVPEAFLSTAIDSLARLRTDEGLSVIVAPLESVQDEFNGGRMSAYAIKRFMSWAVDAWHSRFLVLVGNGSVDGRHVLTSSGTCWIPIALIPGPVPTNNGLEMIASDPWYGWRLHDAPTTADGLEEPEVYVGRLPANSSQDVHEIVAKLASYENFTSDQTWRRNMLLLADDCYSSDATFGSGTNPIYHFHPGEIVFRSLNQAVRATIGLPDSAGMTLANPDLVDLRTYLADSTLYDPMASSIPSPGLPVDTLRVAGSGYAIAEARCEAYLRTEFRDSLYTKINRGVLWWNYQGHANPYVLSHEGFYRNRGSDPDNGKNFFMNDGKPFFFTAFSCHANEFGAYNAGDPTVGNSLGEDMLTLPVRGAIASWASSGYEAVPSNLNYHLNVELARSLFERPPHDDELAHGARDDGARVLLGEAIALTLLNYLPTVQQSSLERGVGLTYNLLGDPATRLWVGPTQIAVTANGAPVTNGQPVRLVSGGSELQLEAELVSNVGIDSIAIVEQTQLGTRILPESLVTITPPFPDTLPGGSGGRRYHVSYTTSLTGPARFTYRVTDRYGVTTTFDVIFQFDTELFAGSEPVPPNAIVAADARLSLLVLSPFILRPADLTLRVDSLVQSFVAQPARGDTTGRQFLLGWDHAPYHDGAHTVRLEGSDIPTIDHTFRVVSRFALGDAYAFPNPFDDDLGTRFVFNLTGEAPIDVLVRVFSASGRLIYETHSDGLSPGHHEIPWNGLDEEGSKLANGVYFYKLVAHGPQGTSSYEGRLVKLRRPRHVAETSGGTAP